MSRKKPNGSLEFVLFNVLYEDGTVTSNRRVPAPLLGTLEGDGPATTEIEAQDREIGERSGRPRPRVKSVERAATRGG